MEGGEGRKNEVDLSLFLRPGVESQSQLVRDSCASSRQSESPRECPRFSLRIVFLRKRRTTLPPSFNPLPHAFLYVQLYHSPLLPSLCPLQQVSTRTELSSRLLRGRE